MFCHNAVIVASFFIVLVTLRRFSARACLCVRDNKKERARAREIRGRMRQGPLRTERLVLKHGFHDHPCAGRHQGHQAVDDTPGRQLLASRCEPDGRWCLLDQGGDVLKIGNRNVAVRKLEKPKHNCISKNTSLEILWGRHLWKFIFNEVGDCLQKNREGK
jgi:hypothetical protein